MIAFAILAHDTVPASAGLPFFSSKSTVTDKSALAKTKTKAYDAKVTAKDAIGSAESKAKNTKKITMRKMGVQPSEDRSICQKFTDSVGGAISEAVNAVHYSIGYLRAKIEAVASSVGNTAGRIKRKVVG